ncbi:glycoside hydrolase family 130 protein [Melioribacteraceae bacterium 4301-Me]|uniref:glycoside hydrolase family 130 protein n=1 Tax=Pyranulibacter aquaticus TaxID=3163344 RepID=UPI003598EFA7
MGIIKYSKNPILTKKDVPFNVNSIFNAGSTKINDKYLLMCRVEMPNGRSSFVKAVSDNGYDFTVDSKLTLTPQDHKEHYKYVEWGIEDSRITKINDSYYLTYTGYSKYMPLVILAETKDFSTFKIFGPITEPSNKDCTIFPEKIDGMYWKIDRPNAEHRRDIWISSSPDLLHWGNYKVLMEPAEGTWENDKIGSSSQPIKTKDGWLLLYHGVRGFGISSLYKIGVVLLDLQKPWIVKGKSQEPILSPEFNYERIGDVQNVVFSCGWIDEPDGKVKIYYSGADSNICLAETSIDYLLTICK